MLKNRQGLNLGMLILLYQYNRYKIRENFFDIDAYRYFLECELRKNSDKITFLERMNLLMMGRFKFNSYEFELLFKKKVFSSFLDSQKRVFQLSVK